MKTILVALFTLLMVTTVSAQSVLTGHITHVRDGDTIEVGKIGVATSVGMIGLGIR